MSLPAAEYRPRHPQDSDYYHCVEDYFETFVQGYDEQFSRQYGFWRLYIKQVIYRYLDYGDMSHGFARVKCKDCGHEYLLAFSCKRRHFCPSCHQKRVVEFGEWLLAGGNVFTYSKPGRTDGSLLRLLQQRRTGETERKRNGQCHPLYP